MGTGRTATTFKDLAPLGIPAMPLLAFEVVPDVRTQIVAFQTSQAALRQQFKKPLPHDSPGAQLARSRAACDDACAPLKFMSLATLEKIVRIGTGPLGRQERETRRLRNLRRIPECLIRRACHIQNYPVTCNPSATCKCPVATV